MKKIFFLSCLSALMLGTACDEFDYSTPTGETTSYTATTMAEANTTIADLKSNYSSAISGSSFEKITTDVIFEGCVVANDISGNLYQTLIVRDGDNAIVVAINDYSLWAHFPVGTRIRVNMNGLYIGGYGKMAKIGTPYYTSSNNLRQGAMLKTLVATNIMIVGFNADAAEVTPVEIDAAWLKSANMDQWGPMIVKLSDVNIHGYAADGVRSLVYADANNEDAGYGVNDTIMVGTTKLIFRTSSSAAFAYDTIPSGKVDVVGVLTRYSSTWQMQIRDINDVTIK